MKLPCKHIEWVAICELKRTSGMFHMKTACCVVPAHAAPPTHPSLSHRHVTFKWGRRWASPPVKCVSEMTWLRQQGGLRRPGPCKEEDLPICMPPLFKSAGARLLQPMTRSAGPVTPKTHGVHVSLHGKPGEWMLLLRHTQLCRCS